MRLVRSSLRALAGAVVVVACLSASAHAEGSSLLLIPTPRSAEIHIGTFPIAKTTALCLTDPTDEEVRFAAAQLSDEVETAFGFRPKQTASPAARCILIGRIPQPGAGPRGRVPGGAAQAGTKALGALQKRLAALSTLLADSIGNEGYILQIEPQGIVLAARTGAGVFYGVQTLKQIIRSARGTSARASLPCLRVVDWPALRYRGWSHDISRGPIPTMEFLKRIVATMAEYKQNAFTLYTEHVFRLQSHPEIAPADGITAEQIAELTAFARRYHVELIGNAQSFGHMENILASPFYEGISENGWAITPAREEAYRFLKDLYGEVVPAYESALFHINCDEVTGLGTGPARRMVDSMGEAEVYAYHINRIADIIRPYGKRLLMWGDIAVGNPQIINRLPKDLIVVSWGYDGAESFDGAILPFRRSGFQFMVAPGVSCWGQVWPNMSNAVVNISNYVRDGAKLGAMGMLNTIWMDDGENLSHYNWHGLIWGAECSWAPARPLSGPEAVRDRERRIAGFNSAFDALFFGMPGATETLFLFDSLRMAGVRNLGTDQAFWSSLLEQYPEEIGDSAREANTRAAAMATNLVARLQGLHARGARNGESLDAALFAARRALFTTQKNLARIAIARAMRPDTPEDAAHAREMLPALLDTLHALKADYVKLWQRENRSWSLSRVLERYDRLGRQILDLDRTVFIRPENVVREGRRNVALATPFGGQPIYYTTDGSEPTLRSARYESPFSIDRSALVRARVIADKRSYGLAERTVMVHKAVGKLSRLNSRPSSHNPAYAAGGPMGLLDGLRGSESFSDGFWQGYQGQDLDIVIDLGNPTGVRKVTIGLLQQSYSWILMPERVQVFSSPDGKEFSLINEVVNSVDPKEEGTIIRDVSVDLQDLTTRYLRLVARSPGKLPAWHHAAGNDAYIFADEIVVE